MKRRNLKLSAGQAEAARYSCKVVLNVGGYAGNTEFRGKVELDPYDTAALVRELRRELRKVKAFVDDQVAAAEGSL